MVNINENHSNKKIQGGIPMKSRRFLYQVHVLTVLRNAFIAISVILLAFSCAKNKEPGFPEMDLEGRESILDRKVFIEPELITDIPQVERWCDRLDLKKHRIDVGDAELYIEEQGKGTPLVLINGGPGGTHHYFHPWFSKAAKYARVIYYDQRGCGLSDFKPGEKGYSVHQAVEDLDAIRKALDIDKWVVLGYSYGGFLAQFYTTKHPEHVAGLILLGASPGMHADTGQSRQSRYMSEEEKERLKEIQKQLRQFSEEKDLPRKKLIQILLYNNFLNGDWKRQNFYKPTPEEIAQIALYEWDHDENFNSIMGRSQGFVDLTGAFDECPIPTLILEGKYDLTWGEEKPEVLKSNHPRAEMVFFENAGHGIYNEEPEQFFSVLKDFMKNIPEVPDTKISSYKASLESWLKKLEAALDRRIQSMGWGWHSSQELAQHYSRESLDQIQGLTSLLRTGFALYDVENYDEALFVFERMQRKAAEQGKESQVAMALIWQGHMLDLRGKREEAIIRYQKAAEMNLDVTWMHSQYSLKYSLSPYARERMTEPFERIENRTID
ncbi:MAG: alpha/beta fold hydrolase [Candidatus Aminicenantes bacterium]|nr:alpha/beta fold hydrolase [Candidatus Aminicenantes bacterium]